MIYIKKKTKSIWYIFSKDWRKMHSSGLIAFMWICMYSYIVNKYFPIVVMNPDIIANGSPSWIKDQV